jgi:TRAP-type C4-dicarboxylate transport system permease small subunit
MKAAARVVASLASTLEWVLAAFAGLMMLCLLAASSMGVYDRYVQQLSWGSFDQWARMALLGLVFSALPVAIRRGEAIRLHLFESCLGRAGRRRLHAVFDACVILVCMVYLSTARPMIQVGSSQGVMGTPLDYGAVYAAAMVCFAAIAVFRGEALLQRWRRPIKEP